MVGEVAMSWQASLLEGGYAPPEITRVELANGAWVDHAPGWLEGSDELFAWLVDHVDWEQPDRPMYGQKITQPRLSAWWGADDEPPEQLASMPARLSKHYDVDLASIGVNLYRDGRDSVAWPGDRIARVIEDPLVAIVSLGDPRRFLLRAKGGGSSLGYSLGHGDLLVMGGTCQRTWQHSVPKVAA